MKTAARLPVSGLSLADMRASILNFTSGSIVDQ